MVGDTLTLASDIQVSFRVVSRVWRVGEAGRISGMSLTCFFLLFISSLYNLASLELRENLLTYLPE